MGKKKKRKTRAEKEKVVGWNSRFLMTDKKFMGMIVIMFRKQFRNTRRTTFIEESRLPYKGPKPTKYVVYCEYCEREMGWNEKHRPVLKAGNISKREVSRFDVDHVNGITPLKTFEDIEIFCNDLFYGQLQILCYECHKKKTLSLKKEKK